MKNSNKVLGVFCKFLSPITFLIPKKNIILFESHSDFCDSSKVLFEYMITNNLNQKYKIVWAVENIDNFKDFKINNVYFFDRHPKTIRGKIIKLYYAYFSKYTFYTHVFYGIPYNHGQIRYFLNHSCFPIKNLKDCFWNWKYNSYIEVSSNLSGEYRSKVLNGGKEIMIDFGLPRNDYLFMSSNEKEKLNIDKFNKIIIWMPTFKHHKHKTRNDYKNDYSSTDISLLNNENINDINEKLKENNTLLLIKYHPAQDMSYVNNYSLSNVKSITNKDLFEKNVDLYKLLSESDALITDFSSVYFDYLLLDKPIAFELCDKEKYENGRGFLMSNPLDFMPGNKIYNSKDLETFINEVCNNKDLYKKERSILKNKIHKYQDGKSSERILKLLGLIK